MQCEQCSASFETTNTDREFYKKIDIPEPTLCPDCRSQKRLAFRNERNLYKRKCSLCGKDIVSIYSPDKTFPVYCQECFWSDKWNALNFGLDFNLKEPFFPQFDKLIQKIPRLAIVNKQSENSDYCNYSFANKNCYLTFGNHYEEDCIYGHYSTKNKNCVDYLCLYESEFCYECTYSKNCYRSVYLDHCETCQECYFSVDLKGCKNCFFSANLRQKQYYILNKPYSKEDYFKKLESYSLSNYQGFSETKRFYLEDFRKKFPFRAIHQTNSEDCEGNNLENSKNLKYCFDCTGCDDCAYGFQMDETNSSMDMNCMGYDRSEVCYQTIGCSGIFDCIACDSCWHDNNLRYCNLCFSSKNCFGCISLQRSEYCIFNKQCSKEEYEELVPKIIEQMKKDEEWGKFFPPSTSPFGYNETVAQEYLPLEKTDALKKGFKWSDYESPPFKVKKTIPAEKLPDETKNIPDDILNWAITCEVSGKPFRIISQELKFYRELSLPIPHKHPDIRHQERMELKNPRQLWKRNCQKCNREIQTTYSPERPEIVYCEQCYLKEVY